MYLETFWKPYAFRQECLVHLHLIVGTEFHFTIYFISICPSKFFVLPFLWLFGTIKYFQVFYIIPHN